MNSIMERWVTTLRAELLDPTLIWNQTHRQLALGEYERHYNQHRTHRSLVAAAPLRACPQPPEPDQIERLTVCRQDRLGGRTHPRAPPAPADAPRGGHRLPADQATAAPRRPEIADPNSRWVSSERPADRTESRQR